MNVVIEPTLAAFAIGGAVLTFGLLCRWGRVFPRWIPVLRGRPVPLWFPLGLGGSAAVGIFGFGRGLLLTRLGYRPPAPLDEFQLWGQPVHDPAYWGADGLGWFCFPLWSISLVLALTAYALRATFTAGAGESSTVEALPSLVPERRASLGACRVPSASSRSVPPLPF